MNDRADALKALLALRVHPEGGWYTEIHRSTVRVTPADGRGDRAGITSIYFLMVRGEEHLWHRVRSDELWHWIEGAPLRLLTRPERHGPETAVRLGPVDAAGTRPVGVVRAGEWQRAEVEGAYCLVSCDVGPGFEFADFEIERA